MRICRSRLKDLLVHSDEGLLPYRSRLPLVVVSHPTLDLLSSSEITSLPFPNLALLTYTLTRDKDGRDQQHSRTAQANYFPG